MTAKRFFYILCGALAVIILASGAGYYYASRYLQEGTKELSQRLADEQLADERISSLTDLQKQYERLQPLIPTINNALPTEKNQTQIALQLRNIANHSGMTLDDLTFAASAAPGPVSQTVKVGDVLAIPVTFKLSGSYDQLQQFLSMQEQLNRYSSVTSLNINSKSNRQIDFDVALNVFMKP
jgi:Tfp pilus assembly protein PilO